ncbi:MAG: hypothetical protein JNM07_13645 [Phycisphaerae bacterium]|nr:hypothetical protein [Phycisphaerae bacterium]
MRSTLGSTWCRVAARAGACGCLLAAAWSCAPNRPGIQGGATAPIRAGDAPAPGLGEVPVAADWLLDQLAPEALRIHPLTRLERDGSGGVVLVLHVDLLDATGTGVKWLGVMRIELRRPPLSPDVGSDEPAWAIDLTDAARAGAYFDGVARGFVFVLAGVPGWVAAADGGGSGGGSGGGTVVVEFAPLRTGAGGDGHGRTLRDTLEVGG